MESEDNREEYVLNESGMIWAGTDQYKHIWYWNFAQVCESNYTIFRTIQNFGRRKFWRIWQIDFNLPKYSQSNIS